METVETVYYTCLNKDCEKYRNVFAEGDQQHANCERERLFLEGERRGMPMWARIAGPALILAVAGVVAFRRARRDKDRQEPPMFDQERRTQTWSGTEAHLDEREGHAVPPPIT